MADLVVVENVEEIEEDAITIIETRIKVESEIDDINEDPLIEDSGNFLTVLVPEDPLQTDVKPVVCTKCFNIIDQTESYTSNAQESEMVCNKCQISNRRKIDKSIPNKKDLMNAINNCKNTVPFRCHYCSKMCNTKEIFYDHIRVHAAKKKNPFLCGMCGKNFKEMIQFKKHICARNVLKCYRCSKQFESIFRLENHYLVHTKYKCEICGKYLSSRNVLEEHKLVHTNEYPFQCEVCKRKFRQKSKFNSHFFKCKPKQENLN